MKNENSQSSSKRRKYSNPINPITTGVRTMPAPVFLTGIPGMEGNHHESED
jgi:hypothetical protein